MKRAQIVAALLSALLLTGCGALSGEPETGQIRGLVGAPPAPAPPPNAPTGTFPVQRVVDGDTLYVTAHGQRYGIRVIGLDTPETVHPRMGVQCYGPEASDRAKELLTGQTVHIGIDPTQGNKDKYDRLLRYVTLPDGTDFAQRMIADGYGTEYTYRTHYDRRDAYLTAQTHAADAEHGLWSECVGK